MMDFDAMHAAIAAMREKQLFFIGGSVKSGTTWLQMLLDAHPEIACKGEGHFMNELAPALNAVLQKHNKYLRWKNRTIFGELDGYPGFSADQTVYLLTASITLLLHGQIRDRGDVRVVGEKTPDNLHHFRFLAAMFPKARFVHVVRDGRDCAVSGWYHNLRATPEWTEKTYGTIDAYIPRFAEIWAKEMAEAEDFRRRAPGRCLTVRYEDLSAAPEATLAPVLRFLGVADDAGILAACCAAGAFERLSGGRPRGQEDQGSFFRKGEVGDWRNHFDAPLNAAFQRTAGAWLDRFGYA